MTVSRNSTSLLSLFRDLYIALTVRPLVMAFWINAIPNAHHWIVFSGVSLLGGYLNSTEPYFPLFAFWKD